MNKRPGRLTVSIEKNSLSILRDLEEVTGLSPAQVVQRLAMSHMRELLEYHQWLKSIPANEDSLRARLGPTLLHAYGCRGLIQAIKDVDPTFKGAL